MTDKLDSSKEPSKGAMSAAKHLIGHDGSRLFVHNDSGSGQWEDQEHIAELIDRETKAGEMAALLRKLANTLALGYSYKSIDELAREAKGLLTDLYPNEEKG